MKSSLMKLGAAAIVAALAVAVALIAFPGHPLAALAVFGMGVAGVTVTYDYPVSGSTAPTIAQTGANGANMVTATVNMGDTDTTAPITHNFQEAAANPGYLWPLPRVFILNPGTAAPIFSWNLTNTNIAVLNKVSAAGSGGTYGIVLMRPHSIIT